MKNLTAATGANRAVRNGSAGFTLIELMITLAVIAILTMIALPSYSSYLARAKRADARSQLVQAAQFMQRFKNRNLIAPLRQFIGACNPGRTGTDHRYLNAVFDRLLDSN